MLHWHGRLAVPQISDQTGADGVLVEQPALRSVFSATVPTYLALPPLQLLSAVLHASATCPYHRTRLIRFQISSQDSRRAKVRFAALGEGIHRSRRNLSTAEYVMLVGFQDVQYPRPHTCRSSIRANFRETCLGQSALESVACVQWVTL